MMGLFLILCLLLFPSLASAQYNGLLVDQNGSTYDRIGHPVGLNLPPPAPIGSSPVLIGPQIASLLGTTSGLSGTPDTNPIHFGNYNAAGGSLSGIGLIGGPLLTDLQAAQKVVSTQQSTLELNSQCFASAPDALACPHGIASFADNDYFEAVAVPIPGSYTAQVTNFSSNYIGGGGASGGSIGRIDGACPLINPTSAEVLQWAANKWGINPLLFYAEATQESAWDQASLGDVVSGIGTSSGIMQIPDRNQPSHGSPGLVGISANLGRENTCFNADYYGAQTWELFNGFGPIVANGPNGTHNIPAGIGNIGWTIQLWFSGVNGASDVGAYTTLIANHITSADWVPLYFQGQSLPF